MSHSSNTQRLGDAIEEMLQLSHLNEKMDERKLVLSWKEVVGPYISKHTSSIAIANKKLTVTVDSSALRSELFHSRTKIMNDINTLMEKRMIEEIVFR